MFTRLFLCRQESVREARLICNNQDNRSGMRQFFDNVGNGISNRFQGVTNPEVARQEGLQYDGPAVNHLLTDPTAFTAPAQPQLAGTGGRIEELKSQPPELRLLAVQQLRDKYIPAGVQARYAGEIGGPLNIADIERARTILTVISIILGQGTVEGGNPLTSLIAQESLAERNNGAEAPGRLAELYRTWLDARPTLAANDATNPAFVLRPDSGIPPEVRGALNNMSPEAQVQFLTSAREIIRQDQVNTNLGVLVQRQDHLSLVSSVEARRNRNAGRTLMENWENASGTTKIATVVGLGALVYMMRGSKTLRYGGAALGLYLAYDYYGNGNANALNDLAKNVQGLFQFSGAKIRQLAVGMGFTSFSRPQDRFDAIARFAEKNRLPLGPGMTGMAALSDVKLSSISDAFDPVNMQLSLDDGSSSSSPAGNNLYLALKTAMKGYGQNAQEQQATVQYLRTNNAETAAGVAHIFYLIGAQRSQNIADARRIADVLPSVGGNVGSLPTDLQEAYRRIMSDGITDARVKYPNESLMSVVQKFNSQTAAPETAQVLDGSAPYSDAESLPARSADMALTNALKSINVNDPAETDKLKADGGLIDAHAKKIIDNAIAAGVVAPEARTVFEQKMNDIRRSPTATINEILRGIRYLEYAVYVASTQETGPLTADKLTLMTGPGEVSATGVLNNIGSYLSRVGISLPRGFTDAKSLGDVEALLTEPWIGNGAVSSGGAGFKLLKDKFAVYKLRLAELKDTKKVAENIVNGLPATVVTNLEGRDKAITFVETLLKQGGYADLVNKEEELLSVSMAAEIAKATRVTHTTDGVGRFSPAMLIGLTKQQNLLKVFDSLFAQTMGAINRAGFLRGVNYMETMKKFDEGALDTFDYGTEDKRKEATQFGRELTVIYVLRRLSGTVDGPLKLSLGNRVKKIYEKMKVRRKADIQVKLKPIPTTPELNATVRADMEAANKREAELIANLPSFKNGLPELFNMLKIFELTADAPEDVSTIPPINPGGTPVAPTDPGIGIVPPLPGGVPPGPGDPGPGLPPLPIPPGPGDGAPPPLPSDPGSGGVPPGLERIDRNPILARLTREAGNLAPMRALVFRLSARDGMIEYGYSRVGFGTGEFIAESSAADLQTISGADLAQKYREWEGALSGLTRERARTGIVDRRYRDPLKYQTLPPL